MYMVKRFFRDERWPKTVKAGLTLEEAKEHCSRDDTRGPVFCPNGHGYVGLRGNETQVKRAKHCPDCGANLVADWFDGFVEME